MPKKSRKTRQKEAIEKAAMERTGFFTAEELYGKVRSKEDTIGVATVYRFLKRLDAEGRLHAYSCGKVRVYSAESVNHCHFLCHRCGKTEHFQTKKAGFLGDITMGKPCHFQIDVHGICNKCLEKI